MSEGATDQQARPQRIEAVPVRHPWRWVAIVVIAVLTAMFLHMIFTNDAFSWSVVFDSMFRPAVLRGVQTTVVMTLLAMAIGIALGVVIAVMRLSPSRLLSTIAWIYTWFFRAIPRLVLLTLFGNLGILYRRVDFGLPFDRQLGNLLGIDLNTSVFGLDARTFLTGFMAGLLGLALSEAAYMAEIVRAGIQSIDTGQGEAASALGMRRLLVVRRIVLPQAMRVIVPPTGNEVIAMLKDTSLLGAVPVTNELFYQLQAIGTKTFQPFPLLMASLLWYLGLTSILLVGQYFLERRFARGFSRTGRAAARAVTVGGTH